MARSSALTPFGKYIRKLRIDHNRILADDAEHLQVTVSYLSAVEVGKKAVPRSWEPVLAALYDIADDQRNHFRKLIVISDPSVKISLPAGTDDLVRRAAHMFCERYKQFTTNQWQKIGELLGGNDLTYDWSFEK